MYKFRSVENPVDIFIRQQSRECETIIEEDEADLSEWYSTRTSQGVKSVHESVSRSSPPGSHRRHSAHRPRPDSPLKIVEFHSPHRIPSDMSQVDSQDISLSRYPFYNNIKKQVMNLNFETSSDWSDEARFLDEVREVGLKDEGRLTYHEMLLAYRRSQGIRRSMAKSNDSSDDSINIDYLPSQNLHSKPRQSPAAAAHAIPPAHASSRPDDIYVRLADDSKKGAKTRSRDHGHFDKRDHSHHFHKRDHGHDRGHVATSFVRPAYNQSVYGQFRRIPNYQSYPNYPRYRNNVPAPIHPRPATYIYYILAFILLVLMLVSLIPIMFV